MTTYKDLPGPHICDFWTREASAANYDDGSTFQIGRIDMVANTGTYLDSPFHRYAEGADLAELDLPSLADLPGIVVRRPWEMASPSTPTHSTACDVDGKAVLVHTGWDRHWRTDAYFGDHPFLTAEAADWLAEHGAALVGIDSCNIDNMHVRARAGSHPAARRRHPDLRAYDGPWQPARRRIPLFRGPPKVKRHGNFPGARLRRARLSERSASHSGMIALSGMASMRAMDDRHVRLADIRPASAVSAAAGLDDEQPAIDLRPPVHPRGILLADEAALGEADAVQLGRVAFEPEDVAELGAAFGDAEAQAMLEPAGRRPAGGASQRRPRSRKPRIDRALAVAATNGLPALVALDRDRAAQAIDREALDEVVGGSGLAIEQQILAIGPDEEIEQAFALRSEQPGPDRKRARHIAGHQPLDEPAHVLARQADDGAIGEGGRGPWEIRQLGSRRGK